MNFLLLTFVLSAVFLVHSYAADMTKMMCADVIDLNYLELQQRTVEEENASGLEENMVDVVTVKEGMKEVSNMEMFIREDSEVIRRNAPPPMNPDISLAEVKVQYFVANHLVHLYYLSLLTDYNSNGIRQEFENLLGPYREFFQNATNLKIYYGNWENVFEALGCVNSVPKVVSIEAARKDVMSKYDIFVNEDQTVKDRLHELMNQYYPLISNFLEDEALHLFLLFLMYQLNSGMKVTYTTSNVEKVSIVEKNDVTKKNLIKNTMQSDMLFLIENPQRFVYYENNSSPSMEKFIKHVNPYFKIHRAQYSTVESTWANVFMQIAGEKLRTETISSRPKAMISIL